MDNITHSVIGLGVGELLQRSLPPESAPEQHATRRRMLLFSCWAASNFPDLDLFLVNLLPSPLGYLLQHRGHSHTVLFAIPQALLLCALIWLCWPAARRLLRHSAVARAALPFSVGLGLALHLSLDYLNSYGLHPFYPFDARWWYGDMTFIVEPLFWVALGAPMAMTARRRLPRALLLAALAVPLLVFAIKAYLGWGSFALLLLTGAGLAALQWRAGPGGRRALLAGLALCCAFVALQGVLSALGKQQIRAALHAADPATRVLDVVMTAFPSQPLCWSFVTVESNEAAGTYHLRRGLASVAPDWLAPAACPTGLGGAAGSVLGPGLLQQSEHGASLALLRRLQSEDCRVDAWLRFARAPLVGTTAASDLRFAPGPGGNFSAMSIGPARPCAIAGGAGAVPGWAYPRADLLERAVP
ncbi:MAG: metal-dependent hydrolase [Pseudomonadota bacterium]